MHGDPLADRLACLVVASGAILNKGFDHIRFAAVMGVGTVTGLCKPAIIKAPLLLVHGVVRRGPACGSWPRKQWSRARRTWLLAKMKRQSSKNMVSICIFDSSPSCCTSSWKLNEVSVIAEAHICHALQQ